MSGRGRTWRVCASAAVAAALVAGSAWGQDDHFPFGPFRMYSTTTRDEVTVLRFYAVDAEGIARQLRSQDFGLRPAEIHGQIARFDDRAVLLAHLADAYGRQNPQAPPLQELTLAYGIHRLDDDGRPVSFDEETLATWQR